jgi:hypothetical protein
MYKILKPYTLAGIEPTIFCSKYGDADHYYMYLSCPGSLDFKFFLITLLSHNYNPYVCI